MKLTSAQVERTLTQFQAEAIPEDHPVVPQLNSLFGEQHFLPRQQWAEHRGAGGVQPRRNPVGQGGQSR
jgi:hypothetical protein